jgi:hypothetical protein
MMICKRATNGEKDPRRMAYYTSIWDQRCSQMRQELQEQTDLALARRYRCARATVARIRALLQVPPKPPGRRVVLGAMRQEGDRWHP